jgi:hypothetical protein
MENGVRPAINNIQIKTIVLNNDDSTVTTIEPKESNFTTAVKENLVTSIKSSSDTNIEKED